MTQAAPNVSFVRTFVLPAVLLFALPAFGAWFAGHAERRYDAQFLEAVEPGIQAETSLSAEDKQRALAFYRAMPPSRACRDDSPELASYRKNLDEACSDLRQFGWLRGLSLGSIGLGLLSSLLLVASALASFVSRPLQYASFVVGWNALKVSSAVQTLLQGALAVFLSYWMTAIWTQRYFPKLILLVGALAAFAAFGVIVAIFKRPASGIDVEGELVPEERAPTLWARVRELCRNLGTEPPQQIVAGIDDNFFVTESEVRVGDQTLRGRTLYVSLSLLRFLERSEADAVLAHEMAHFSGGDTRHSKRLSPLLTRYVQYLEALHKGVITLPIFFFMQAYYAAFQLSLARSNRARELAADATAAKLTSAQDIARSLVKVGAYSSYRARVEEALFDKNEAHAELGIAARVAQGFVGYAQSDKLHFDLHHAVTPHPFDSHPPLDERLASVAVTLSAEEYAQLLGREAGSSWVEAIQDATHIEQRLWTAYETRFAEAHALALAFRYEPANDEERSHVEKYFPELSFEPKDDGARVTMDFAAVRASDWEDSVSFEQVKSAQVEDRMFKKYLDLKLKDTGMFGGKRSICLSKLETPDALLEAFNRYYARHQIMTQHKAETAASAA